MYIPCTTYFDEQTGSIVNFAQFEEGSLLENECNLVEEISILDSIDELSAINTYIDKSTITDSLVDIWYRSYMHPNINARDYRLKIRDHIRQAKVSVNDWNY